MGIVGRDGGGGGGGVGAKASLTVSNCLLVSASVVGNF